MAVSSIRESSLAWPCSRQTFAAIKIGLQNNLRDFIQHLRSMLAAIKIGLALLSEVN
jgi:hypothetical protein